MRARSAKQAVAAALLLLGSSTHALNPIEVKGQDFVDSATGERFEIIGVDYEPGGEGAYMPQNGIDSLTDPEACLRDAILMQQLGVNTIRVYSVDPDVSHAECVSIFNAAGMYIILDVNSPLPNQSIDQADPASSYDFDYLNRTFAVLDAFRNYPNLLGFFSGNEIVNNVPTGLADPPYIRAVQRDLKQYLAARGGRPIPVGYSAADIRPQLVDIDNYLTCQLSDDPDNYSRIDFFGLNSYSWCGAATFESSTYDQLAADFANTTTPVFFSEYGCNKPMPRLFTEVDALYGVNMTTWSGGLVYEWTQEADDFGLVQINSDASVTLLNDYNTLKARYDSIDLAAIRAANVTADNLKPPACSADLIGTPPFDTNFTLPAQPSGVASLIKAGGAGSTESLVSVTATTMPVAVTGADSSTIAGLTLSMVSSANLPTSSGNLGGTGTATGASASASTSTHKNAAAPALPTAGLIGAGPRSAAVALVIVEVFVQLIG